MRIKSIIKKVLGCSKICPVYAKIITLSPNELLKDRTALITGGTSGIGYSIAEAFLNAGAKVIITGRNEKKIQAACERLKRTDNLFEGSVYGCVLDNTDISSFEMTFRRMLDLCQSPIDILVNNAGLVGGDIATVDEEQYDSILDTNLKGMFFLSKVVATYMKENHIEGNILNMGSSSCLRPAASAYTLSKWGTRGFTMGLAKSLAPYGITVNGIAPGPTATPMVGKDPRSNLTFSNALGRYGLPEEIANMAVVLVSGMGRRIMGDMVYMTGGSGLLTFDDISYQF